MSDDLFGFLIRFYAASLALTMTVSVALVSTYYMKLTDKYHGRQLHLRRGCFIIAVIFVNLLSPPVVAPLMVVGTLFCLCFVLYEMSLVIVKRFKGYWQSKQANSKFRPKSKSKQRSGGAELVFPSSVVRCDADTDTINSHNDPINNDMALPTISSEMPHMPTVLPGIHVRPEATSSEGYRELSVSVDLHGTAILY